MLRLLFFVSTFSMIACSSTDKIKDEKMVIIIRIAQSYKYDLQRGTYTIFNMQGDTTIHFNLTDEERLQVINKYYSLDLHELRGKQTLEDNCLSMPKLYTTLNVQSRGQQQEIIIDEDCSDYKGLFNSKRKKVTAFLHFVSSLLNTKPEIKNAPGSDIMYM